MYGSMEEERGQDVVAPSHIAWTIKKRPASPLDAYTHTSKRTWNPIQGPRGIGKSVPGVRSRGHASDLRNVASWWDPGATNGSHPLGPPANNNGPSYLHQSSYGSTAPLDIYSTGIRDHRLAGSESEPGSFLHEPPIIYQTDGGPPSNIPQPQSSTTDITGPALPLVPVTGGFLLGSAPAAAHGHTPAYPAYFHPGIAFLSPSMRVPVAHDVDGQNQTGAAFLEAHRTQDQFPGHSRWPDPLHRLSQHSQMSTNGAIDYNQRPSPPISGGEGYLDEPPQSLNTFNQFSDVPYSAAVTHHYATPVMDSDSSDAAFSDSHRHNSMSVHRTGHEHDSWADHESLTIRLAASHQYEQQAQRLGRYVEVIHPLDGQYNAQDGGTAYSDVEETVIADDDEVGAKVEITRGSISSTNSADDLHPYSSSSNSSYINLSKSSSVRQDSTQHDLYTRNGSATESNGTGDYTLMPGNPALPGKKPRKKRSEFKRDKLDETNRTRMLKACVACRKQKIRCIANSDDPGAPCAKCQKTTTSKSGKVIHRSVCCRTHTFTSIVLVRPGGLGLTRRWEGTKMADVADPADDTIRTIHILQGLSPKPIVVKVRKFEPKEGDIIYRQWVDDGVQKRLDLEPYCLVDIHATATYFSNYLCETALEGLREAAHSSGELVQETYRMVQEHAAKLHKRIIDGSDTERVTKEWQLLMSVVKLVWSMRHTTGSAWLAGPDKLGMTPPQDESYPLRNPWTREKEVSLPRLIVAQFDSIQNQRILQPSQLKKVLDDLEKNFSSPKDDWFTMYLAVFMLLHEISVASKDRYRWARERHQKKRYGAGKYATLGMYMENLQKASHPLLAYWHYYKCDLLDDEDWDALGPTTKLKTLEPEHVAFMERSAQLMRDAEEANEIPKPPLEGCWEHELFFVSRMFRRDWEIGFQTFNFMDE